MHETPVLSEDELTMIIDFEEENQRLGNFDRIFPLQSNAVHYSRFFEYQRPSNEFLARYLVTLPRGVRTIGQANTNNNKKKSAMSPHRSDNKRTLSKNR